MDILVTGGAGFIGSHLVDAFIDAGHTVAIVDNFSSGKEENVNPKAELLRGDIRDVEFVKDVFRTHSFDVVDHHAAQIDVRKSVADPVFDATVNILGSINLMEAAREFGVKHFIFASTGGAIYGEQDYFPADEQHKTQPESPYGITKRTVELYLEYYRKVYGLEHTIFRYTNVYGPRQDPHGDAGVVAIFSNALLDGKQATIFGDGEQTRDYVFVGDLVRAHVLGLAYLSQSRLFNVSTAIETSVNGLFEKLSTIITNGKATPIYADARKGEQLRSVCTYKKIENTLGWQPKISLEQGLTDTATFFKTLSGR